MKENKIAGVYKVTNIITGDFYIGSSKDIKHRWANHKCSSAHKRQPNSKLYKDMASYGKDKFIFEVIEETDNLKEREQYYIECLKPSYNNYQAKGLNTDRYKETLKRCCKEWYKANRDKELAKMKEYSKAYHQANRDKELSKMKEYSNRLCLYEGETLTLNALALRFRQQGIAHPYKEAKEYLI